MTIFNDGITQNEKLQGFEIGLELAAQEFDRFNSILDSLTAK